MAFWLGLVGALAPEIVRLYKWRFKLADKAKFTVGYFAISLLYGLLGGLVSYALTRDSNAISSIYTGAAFPLIIDAGARQVTGKQNSGTTTGSSGVEELELQRVRPLDHIRRFVTTL